MKTLLIIVGLIVVLLLGYTLIAGTNADVDANGDTVAASVTVDPAVQAEYDRLEANVEAGVEGAEDELRDFVANTEANVRALGAEAEEGYRSFLEGARAFIAGFDLDVDLDVSGALPDVDVDVEVNENEDGDTAATNN